MKKIISATVLALGLAFTVAPAQADEPAGGTPLPICTGNEPAGTCTTPPLPSCRDALAGVACTPDPCAVARAAAEDQVAALNHKIAKQKLIIKRLRHRLHHR